MFIYKITNSINNKLYIGKTIRPIDQRFKRHLHDAINNVDKDLNHFYRAIRKYGSDKFNIELLDTASSEKELSQKEIYWINYYNSIENGYNTAEGGNGGNTYKGIESERMDLIKKKIGSKNLGKLNGMSQ